MLDRHEETRAQRARGASCREDIPHCDGGDALVYDRDDGRNEPELHRAGLLSLCRAVLAAASGNLNEMAPLRIACSYLH
jgi:hypothetical protein